MNIAQRKLLLLPLFILILGMPHVQAQKKYKLVIDAGHGGKDPGRLGTKGKLNEKSITLAIALRLGGYIEELIPNVEVIYTRKDDVFLTLDRVVEIANDNKADFFISIHCNANASKRVQGTRTHIHSEAFPVSRQWALSIEREFATRAKRYSKGIMSAQGRGQNLQVLQYTKMPGVLVETGFLTHPEEERFLNSEYGQKIIASAIFRAFRDLVESNPPKEDRSTFYKIQIMSSSKQENINISKYNKLDMRVEEYKDVKNMKFPYRYLVGREYNKQVAERLAKKVEKMGFKGAFVVEMTDDSHLKMIRHNRANKKRTSQH